MGWRIVASNILSDPALLDMIKTQEAVKDTQASLDGAAKYNGDSSGMSLTTNTTQARTSFRLRVVPVQKKNAKQELHHEQAIGLP